MKSDDHMITNHRNQNRMETNMLVAVRKLVCELELAMVGFCKAEKDLK